MNYYNPYYFVNPQGISSPSLFSGLFKGNLNFSTILNGTQKTLGLVNQAIPIIKEAAPMFRNAKTMFKVMNEFKKIDAPSTNNQDVKSNVEEEHKNYNQNDGGPTFFI